MPCPCGFSGHWLELHYVHSPHCRPTATPGDSASKRPRAADSGLASALFTNQVHATVGKELLKAHQDHYVSYAQFDHVRTLLISIVHITLDFAEDEHRRAHPMAGEFTLSVARGAFRSLPNVGTLIKQTKLPYLRATPLMLGTGDAEARKGAVSFPAHQLVTILLQESTAVRKMAIAASEQWKTGEMYNVMPQRYSDLTDGSRFRGWEGVCGKATPDEALDLRIVLHGWTDEFTPIDGLSQKARKHKYGALLATPVNLPHRIRHYHDHMLLLALYNSRYSKKNGGLVRMLTGIGVDGTQHEDGVTFSGELALGTASPIVTLPNDDDPTGEPVEWRLRIFLLLMSLDWLAAGDFGPFAGSVSARRPCPKCMWTQSCPCAFLAQDDPQRELVCHATHCRGLTPRTHDGTVAIVREHRALAAQPGTMTRLKKPFTETGVFSLHFASEHLLRDVVKDSTIDVMHIFLCGLTRYILSWLTDRLIPLQFSWEALNQRKNAHPWRRGQRVPDLERSKGDTRGSTSIHLNAVECMHFALARCGTPPCTSCTSCTPP